MRAGLLSERLTIQTPTRAKDAIGGDVDTFVDGVSIPAQRRSIRADERFQAQAMGMQVDHEFIVRPRNDITKGTRLAWTPRWPNRAAAVSLEVHGVRPGDSRDEMVLSCGAYV